MCRKSGELYLNEMEISIKENTPHKKNEILELTRTTTKKKNSLEVFKGKFELANK